MWGESEGYANEDEEAAIRQHVGSSALVEVLETPAAATVLKNKKKTTARSLVHFASHRTSDIEQPSNSALLLRTRDFRKLIIGDLQSLDHQLAQVACLSFRMLNGARSLLDESI